MRHVFFLVLLILAGQVNAQPVSGVNHAALMARNPARLLSKYALFADLPGQRPAQAVHPYQLITPLFTDYAVKNRYVFIPNGKKAQYYRDEVFQFPIGSVLIKTFAMPLDLREPEKDLRLIETRLLVHQKNGWRAWAYVWNKDQSDAVLKLAGKRLSLPLVTRNGEKITLSYKVPNKNQCKGCHSLNNEFVPLGPKARNLNRDIEIAGQVGNQLGFWSKAGLLAKVPSSDQIPKVVDWKDKKADINQRARAYLDVNCAHCHRSEGPASNSGLFLTYNEKNQVNWGYKKRPVAAGRGSGGLAFDIEPGKPEQSILIFRTKSIDPGVMMPELGRGLVHREAVEMLSAWIKQLR